MTNDELNNTFEYVDLDTIDPSFKAIPQDVYTLVPIKAEIKEFTYKSGERKGQTGQRVAFQLAVTDHPQYAGRRVFATLFAGDFAFRTCRRISDTTGVPQNGSFRDWLAAYTESKAPFKIMVTTKPKADGSGDDNDVDWKTLAPAV